MTSETAVSRSQDIVGISSSCSLIVIRLLLSDQLVQSHPTKNLLSEAPDSYPSMNSKNVFIFAGSSRNNHYKILLVQFKSCALPCCTRSVTVVIVLFGQPSVP